MFVRDETRMTNPWHYVDQDMSIGRSRIPQNEGVPTPLLGRQPIIWPTPPPQGDYKLQVI